MSIPAGAEAGQQRSTPMTKRSKFERLWNEDNWRGALTILTGSPQLVFDGRVWPARGSRSPGNSICTDFEGRNVFLWRADSIEIAASLFNQDITVNLWEAFNRLDEKSSSLAITAICRFARVNDLENVFTESEIDQLNRICESLYLNGGSDICNLTALN